MRICAVISWSFLSCLYREHSREALGQFIQAQCSRPGMCRTVVCKLARVNVSFPIQESGQAQKKNCWIPVELWASLFVLMESSADCPNDKRGMRTPAVAFPCQPGDKGQAPFLWTLRNPSRSALPVELEIQTIYPLCSGHGVYNIQRTINPNVLVGLSAFCRLSDSLQHGISTITRTPQRKPLNEQSKNQKC